MFFLVEECQLSSLKSLQVYLRITGLQFCPTGKHMVGCMIHNAQWQKRLNTSKPFIVAEVWTTHLTWSIAKYKHIQTHDKRLQLTNSKHEGPSQTCLDRNTNICFILEQENNKNPPLPPGGMITQGSCYKRQLVYQNFAYHSRKTLTWRLRWTFFLDHMWSHIVALLHLSLWSVWTK